VSNTNNALSASEHHHLPVLGRGWLGLGAPHLAFTT